MSDPVALGLISMLGTLLTAIVAALLTAVLKKLERVAGSVDGVATKVDGRFDVQEKKLERYQTEIVRLQAPGATTPYGTPSKSQPVTLSAGVPEALHTGAIPRQTADDTDDDAEGA